MQLNHFRVKVQETGSPLGMRCSVVDVQQGLGCRRDSGTVVAAAAALPDPARLFWWWRDFSVLLRSSPARGRPFRISYEISAP